MIGHVYLIPDRGPGGKVPRNYAPDMVCNLNSASLVICTLRM